MALSTTDCRINHKDGFTIEKYDTYGNTTVLNMWVQDRPEFRTGHIWVLHKYDPETTAYMGKSVYFTEAGMMRAVKRHCDAFGIDYDQLEIIN